MDIQKIVEKLKPYKPEKIILFGSWAYGKQRKESDIDIAVIKKTKIPFWQRAREIRLLCQEDTPMDVFVFTPAEFKEACLYHPFVAEIADKGRVIYERK